MQSLCKTIAFCIIMLFNEWENTFARICRCVGWPTTTCCHYRRVLLCVGGQRRPGLRVRARSSVPHTWDNTYAKNKHVLYILIHSSQCLFFFVVAAYLPFLSGVMWGQQTLIFALLHGSFRVLNNFSGLCLRVLGVPLLWRRVRFVFIIVHA